MLPLIVRFMLFASPQMVLAAPVPPNRLGNPSAEQGLQGWESIGFTVARYRESSDVPATNTYRSLNFGDFLFRATSPTATLQQTIDLTDKTSAIDAGQFTLYVLAWLGAAGGSEDGASLTVLPLDANGKPTGAPALVGPPSVQQRMGMSVQVDCTGKLPVPVGTRKARVTLATKGVSPATAFADAIYVGDVVGVPPARRALRPRQYSLPGGGCSLYRAPDVFPPPTPTPTPSTVPTPTAEPPAVRASIIVPRRTRRVGRSRTVTVARVACPRGASCRIAVPSRVAVKIARRRYTLKVVSPARARSGATARVRVRLSRRAARRLAGRKTRVELLVSVTPSDGVTSEKLAQVTILARRG